MMPATAEIQTSPGFGLSRGEWHAVTIALHDAERPAPRGRALRWLTGSPPPRPLADRRLEAIRAFVCDARRGRSADAGALEALGFNPRQIAALALVAR